MKEFIYGIFQNGIFWGFLYILMNIFRGTGMLIIWSWFLGKKPFKEVWHDPDNELLGFLALSIGGIAWFLISH